MTQPTPAPMSLRLEVSGLSCAGCVSRAEKALLGVDGVDQAAVNLATGTAQIDYHAPADLAGMADALGQAGYPARVGQLTLEIEGMHCASCVGRVETALAQAPGVVEAHVNLATERAIIRYATGATTDKALVNAVQATGYSAHVQDQAAATDHKAAEANRLYWSAIVAAILALPVFVLEMGGHLFPPFHHMIHATIGEQSSRLLQFALTSAVLIGPGRQFYVKGYPLLLRGAPDMNTLVALGTSAAFVFSVIATFAPQLLPAGTVNVYFESTAVIVVLILIGRYLEARAKRQTNDAIDKLLALQPDTARVERDGDVMDIPLSDLRTGDILHIRPGEKIAADGVVLSGDSYVDESMLTGEPVPVQKSAEAHVSAATLNGQGFLKIQATHVGDDTLLAQIVSLVEQAQGAKLPIQSKVDKITAVFVPVVLGLAALTVALWMILGPSPSLGPALVAGISVLIIACPCAMGLATPTSIMVGTGRAAEKGVLFRKGDALQALSEVDHIVFDKTGTLTEGKPRVTTAHMANDWTEAQLLPLVAAVEATSEHPLSQALLDYAGNTGDVAEDVEILTGQGIRARVGDKSVLIGSRALMRDKGIALDDLELLAEASAAKGQTPIIAAVNGQAAALFAVADQIKPDTADALKALISNGKSVTMLTGDNATTARAIADELGITDVISDVMPADKASAIKSLQQKGSVGFVGDGINDAPALAQADVGIAIGTGTDIAVESADVILVSGRLTALTNAMTLASATMRNIRQNLFWAFAYNVMLIPVAAGVLYPAFGLLLSPMLAAFAMAASSVFVVTNALRLRFVLRSQTDQKPAVNPSIEEDTKKPSRF